MHMRVALVHDYLKEYGGAERVLEVLHEMYPDAPLYTAVYAPKYLGPHAKRFVSWQIRESIARFLPFKAKLISPLRIIAPLLFRTFDFSAYDVVIVSATGAYSPNAIDSKGALHVCYYHTPPRYLYGLPTARPLSSMPLVRFLQHVVFHFLRIIDGYSAQRVDLMIANSHNTSQRIHAWYGKTAHVVYPPVAYQPISSKREGFVLCGGRLARPKHIVEIIKACQEEKLPVVVFGRGFAGYEAEVKRQIDLAPEGITFLGEIDDQTKQSLYARAAVFAFAAEDEDFGIMPVEAMAQGTPVVAYRSGGVKETVIDGVTGIFFDTLESRVIKKLLKKALSHTWDRGRIRKQAQKFEKNVFINRLQTQIKENYVRKQKKS
jgi:glycosyltransferase involved in cell wall biosynthesis